LTRARTIFAKHDLPGLAPYRDAVDGRLRAVCAANPRLECRP
jgi:hypothetical protein